jgi:hypothetical protein
LQVDGKKVAEVKQYSVGELWHWHTIGYAGNGSKPTKKEAEDECLSYVKSYLKENQ